MAEYRDFWGNRYVSVDDGCGTCVVWLIIIAAVWSMFSDWYDDHKVMLWTVIIAIIAIIILIVIWRKARKNREEEEAAKAARDEQWSRYVEVTSGWCSQGLQSLREFSNSFAIFPMLYTRRTVNGVFFDKIVPNDVVQLLVYLDHPFFAPVIVDGRIVIKVNNEEKLKLVSGMDLRKPVLIKVNPGDHVEVLYVPEASGGHADLRDFQLAWCFTGNHKSHAFFNYTTYNYLIPDQDYLVRSRMLLARNIYIDFSPIQKYRQANGRGLSIWKTTVCTAMVPEGCGLLVPFAHTDTGSRDLRSSGLIVDIFLDDELIESADEWDTSHPKTYIVVPGHNIRVDVYFDLNHDMTFNHVAFSLLPEKVSQEDDRKAKEYLKLYDAYTDNIDEYKLTLKKIEDLQNDIDGLAPAERKACYDKIKALRKKADELYPNVKELPDAKKYFEPVSSVKNTTMTLYATKVRD